MSTNSYVTPLPFFVTQPPPNYNFDNSWNYDWQQGPNARITSDSTSLSVPPLPPGLPPPPPPPPPSTPPSSPRTPSSHSTGNTSNLDPRTTRSYYNNSYHRRYSNNSSVQYNSRYATSGQYPPTVGQYSSSTRPYSSTRVQYNFTFGRYSRAYNRNSNINYGRNNFYDKRKAEIESEHLKKPNKKKKKPLSHVNNPQRKDWSVSAAQRAIEVEKEYNKRNKSQALIIKFPDLELSRDIVSKFNEAIENVHFQQPCTPRYCFVMLKESADADDVIKQLNKVPFGQGYLSAEFKREREDDVTLGPEDIDPLTLYVGNLAQEVTKEDMVNAYPKHKRVDIGYAKKMKYTRYAFVTFKNVEDSIQAFKKTHSTQMYSKSLIIRFRRLNGTMGMPGEIKPPPLRKIVSRENHNGSNLNSSGELSNTDHNETESHNISSTVEKESHNNSITSSWEMVDVSQWETVDVSQWETDMEKRVDLPAIKQEPMDDSDDEEGSPSIVKQKSVVSDDLDLAFSMHKPKVMDEMKKEKDLGGNKDSETCSNNVKERTERKDSESSSDLSIIPPEQIKKEEDVLKTSTNTYLEFMKSHPKPFSKDSIPVEIKREPSPELEEIYREQSIQTEPIIVIRRNPPLIPRPIQEITTEPMTVKAEPADKEDENDGDDDSSDESDDFNFDKILSNLKARSKRRKK